MGARGGGLAWRIRTGRALGRLLKYGPVKTTPGYAGVPPVHGAVTRRGRVYTHPLADMVARGTISYGLYYGGLRFRADYEASFASGASTINWDRFNDAAARSRAYFGRRSSGTRRVSPRAQFSHSSVEAAQTLERIARRMSRTHYYLLCLVCGRGYLLNEIGAYAGIDHKTIHKYFHEALGMAADLYALRIDSKDKRA